MDVAQPRGNPSIPRSSAIERLAAGEAVHPDEFTDEEILALLPNIIPVLIAASNKPTDDKQQSDTTL